MHGLSYDNDYKSIPFLKSLLFFNNSILPGGKRKVKSNDPKANWIFFRWHNPSSSVRHSCRNSNLYLIFCIRKALKDFFSSRLCYTLSNILLYVLQISVPQHLKLFIIYLIKHLFNWHTISLVTRYRPNLIFRLILQKRR